MRLNFSTTAELTQFKESFFPLNCCPLVNINNENRCWLACACDLCIVFCALHRYPKRNIWFEYAYGVL